jgi:hypothetical protein
MKNILKCLFTLCIILSFSRCSTDDEIKPSLLEDDFETTAASYEDQFLTLQITTNADREFAFRLVGPGAKVAINWGDGEIQKFDLHAGHQIFSHLYDREKNYTIKVSGDIKMITMFYMTNEDLYVNNIHFGGMTNLIEAALYSLQHGPQVVNLSKNKMIERVVLVDTRNMKDIILSTTNKIWLVNLNRSVDLPVSVIDRVVSRVYDSVLQDPRSGYFSLRTNDPDQPILGPPSSYSLNKLKTLHDSYDWGMAHIN